MSVCFAIVKIEMGVFVWNGGGMGKKRGVAQALPYMGNPPYTMIVHISTLCKMSRILFKN
jgi:hypothetical protein